MKLFNGFHSQCVCIQAREVAWQEGEDATPSAYIPQEDPEDSPRKVPRCDLPESEEEQRSLEQALKNSMIETRKMEEEQRMLEQALKNSIKETRRNEQTDDDQLLLDQALANSVKDTRRVEHPIPDAPTKHPTKAEFRDALKYIRS